MRPANSCPRCGRPVFGAQSFCPACGEKLAAPSKGSGFKLLLGVLAVIVLALWGSTFYTLGSRSAAPPRPGANQLVSALAPDVAAAPTLKLSDSQHLAEGKRALAEGYSPSSDPKKAAVGEVAAARWHLKAIASAAPEYREAQELLKEVARRERQAEAAAKQAAAAARPTPEPTLSAEAEDDTEGEESTLSSARREAAPLPTPAQPPASRAGGGRIATAPTAGGSSSDYYTNVEGRQVRRPTFSDSGPPAGASAQCRDGSYSFSRNRRGTCSHHGGVARWL